MKTVIYVLVFFYVTLQSLITNSPIILNAQPGWSEDQQLVFLPGGGWDPRAACCGDTIHLVWWQMYPAYDEVFYKRSTDAGNTWGDDVRLSVEDEQWSVVPGIAVIDSVVHVIWYEEDFGLLYRRSMDGGSTWLDMDSIVPGMHYSSIQAIGDTVYIAGIVSSGGGLQFTRSFDGGITWEPIQAITYATTSPTLRVISDTIIIISYESALDVYCVRSFNGGETWLDSQLVSEGIGSGSQWPTMDTDDSSGIHIVWYDYKYSPYPWTGDIFYRVGKNLGATWDEIDSLTIMHRSTASDVFAEENNVHIVWEDDRNGFGENREIYYRMSRDLGQTWDPEVRLTDASYNSMRPALACGGGYLHLFWQDRRDYGNSSAGPLYYKRKDLSYSIEESNKSTIADYRLHVYPNPFKEITDISFGKVQGVKSIEVKIYDATGRIVKDLLCTMPNALSPTQISWDGTDNLGKKLPCGVYFLEFSAGDYTETKKLILLR